MKRLILFLALAAAMPMALRAATFPELSGGGTEKYYRLYSYRAGNFLKDDGENNNAKFVVYNTETSAQWKFARVGSAASDTFKIVSGEERELQYKNDGNRFITVAAGSGSTFVFKPFNNDEGFVFQLWCIEANHFINHTGDEICAYGGSGSNEDGNNFSAVTDYCDLFPILSTSQSPVWYQLQSVRSGKAYTGNGKDQKIIQLDTSFVSNDQLFRFEGTCLDFKIVSKTDGLKFMFKDEGGGRFFLTDDEGDSFSFVRSGKSPEAWLLKHNTQGKHINDNDSREAGLWDTGDDDGNRIKLIPLSTILPRYEGAPELSTSGSPKWYSLNFQNGAGAITTKTDDESLELKGWVFGDDKQLFRLEGDDCFGFKIVSKATGKALKFIKPSGEGNFSTADLAAGDLFSLIPIGDSPTAWELQHNDRTLHYDNTKLFLHSGLGLYYHNNDGGCKLKFIDDAALRDGLPKLSTSDAPQWYQLQFETNDNKVFVSKGEGNEVDLETLRESGALNGQLFRLEGDYENGFKVISKDANMEFKYESDRKFILTAASGGSLLLLGVNSSSPAKWSLKFKDVHSDFIEGGCKCLYGDANNDGKNHIKFIPVDFDKLYAGAPKLSTDGDTTWYQLQTTNNNTVITANGDGAKIGRQVARGSTDQTFRLEGSYDNGFKVISKVNSMELKKNGSNEFILATAGESELFFFSKNDDSPEKWSLQHSSGSFIQAAGCLCAYGSANDEQNRIKFINFDFEAWFAGAPTLDTYYHMQFLFNGAAITAKEQDAQIASQALKVGSDIQLLKLVGSYGDGFKVISKVDNMELKKGDGNDKIIFAASGSGDVFFLARNDDSPAAWSLQHSSGGFVEECGCIYGSANDTKNRIKFSIPNELFASAPALSSSEDITWYSLQFTRGNGVITATTGSRLEQQMVLDDGDSKLFKLEGNDYSSFKVISKADGKAFKYDESEGKVVLAAAAEADLFFLAAGGNLTVWALGYNGKDKYLNSNGFILYSLDDGSNLKFIEEAAVYVGAPELSTEAAPKWYYLKSDRIDRVAAHKGVGNPVSTEALADDGVRQDSQLFRFEGAYATGVQVVGKLGGALRYHDNAFYMEPKDDEGAPSEGAEAILPKDSTSISLYGNAYLTSGRGGSVTKDGITGWASAEAVYSAFFKTSVAGELLLYLRYTSYGESTVEVTVGPAPDPGKAFTGTPFTVTLPRSPIDGSDAAVYIGKIDNCSPAGYQRVDFKGVSRAGSAFATAKALVISGAAATSILCVPAEGDGSGRRNAPSVHMFYQYPDTDTAEWFYNEVTASEGMDPPATFFMVSGFDGGYSGIQPSAENGVVRVLFSVWAPHETDDPNTIPDSLKVICLDTGEFVTVQMFGGEGSGTQTFISTDAKDRPKNEQVVWTPGQTYKFLVRIHPSKNVGFTKYEASDYTAYFYDPNKKEWKLIARLRRPKTTLYYRGAYSFVEGFTGELGHLTRRASFGNQWIRLKNGTWKEVRSGKFATDGSPYRSDHKGGIDDNGRFFLQNGGFFNDGTTPYADFVRTDNAGAPAPLTGTELEALEEQLKH